MEESYTNTFMKTHFKFEFICLRPQSTACGLIEVTHRTSCVKHKPVVITNLIVTLIVSDSVVDASSQRQLQSRRRAPERHRDHKATETQRCDFDFDFMNQNRLSLEQMSLPSSLRIPRPIQNLLSVGKSEKHRTAGGVSLCPSDTNITSTQTAACFPGKSQSMKGRRPDGSKLLLKLTSRQDTDEGKGAEVDAFANVGIDELSYNHRYCRSTGSTSAASDLSPPRPPSTSDVRDGQRESTDRPLALRRQRSRLHCQT